ncbi:ribonuclease H-like domain-containing protein [Xylariaceae sp. FL0016]|nr:ribonuclease H-like domain-containing protein [Xylariaceae sp. FL0016]
MKIGSSVGESSSPSNPNHLPCRPAFGTQGVEVVLWANYFKLGVPHRVLYKYDMMVKRMPKEGVGEVTQNKTPENQSKLKAPKRQAKPQGVGKSEEPPEVKGKKLGHIIKSALDKLDKSVPFVTEYKSKLISLSKLSLPKGQTVKVAYDMEGRHDEYEVRFTGPQDIHVDHLRTYLMTMHDPTSDGSFPKFADAIDALSILTGFHARQSNTISSVGRSRHFPLEFTGHESEMQQLEFHELNQLIRGYFQSTRPATGRLLLNVNVSHGVFRRPGSVASLIDQMTARMGRWDPFAVHKLLSRLRAKRTVFLGDYRDPNNVKYYEKTIWGLADKFDGAGERRPKVPKLGAKITETQFYLAAPAPDGLKADAYCSVAAFFEKKFKYTCNPKYPAVNVGTKLRPVYAPAELVEILPGQAVRRKTTPDETRDMINFSCRPPAANATSISGFGRTCLGLDDNNNVLTKFGITVDKTLLTVKGRELTPPSILYLNQRLGNQIVNVWEGGWNMADVKFFKPCRPIRRWMWMHIDYSGPYAHRNHDDVARAVLGMVAFLRTMGIPVNPTPLPSAGSKVAVDRGNPYIQLKAHFDSFGSEEKPMPEFVFVVLPGRKTDTSVYEAIKLLGDVELGFHTVNFLAANIVKQSLQLYANLGLKVNLKMGGANHRLSHGISWPKGAENTMVVGYDVTHPTNMGGNAGGLPSLVGMVASVDKDLGQWPATAWAQSGKVEMLDPDILEERFKGRLELYRKHSKVLPDNIIIFRDGVSEGQFFQVLEKELPSIRAACASLYKQQPRITILVSVKRHQTRFYPTDPNHTTRGSNNIKNGTIVDRGVTQAKVWDFFLTAHKGLQGTSRPAHYTVLLDEVFRSRCAGNAANALEKFTYEMCHLFGRATKAVSICPPAYYADIVCTRQRVYLADLFDRSDTASTASSTQKGKESVPTLKVHDSLRDTMYYI